MKTKYVKLFEYYGQGYDEGNKVISLGSFSLGDYYVYPTGNTDNEAYAEVYSENPEELIGDISVSYGDNVDADDIIDLLSAEAEDLISGYEAEKEERAEAERAEAERAEATNQLEELLDSFYGESEEFEDGIRWEVTNVSKWSSRIDVSVYNQDEEELYAFTVEVEEGDTESDVRSRIQTEAENY